MNIPTILHSKFLQNSSRIYKLIPINLNVSRNTSTSSTEQIVIPRRIPRNSTDILRALESTIGKDPTASHYKYHDDPYLIPKSNLDKRSLAMAHEAGRKAAHWVRKENVDLFQHKEAEPFIDLFAPPKIYTKDSNVSVADLEDSIRNVNVSDAVLIYKLLQGKTEIPGELMQDMLELLCFYNSEDTLSDDFIEERWFRQSAKGNERQRKTWKDGAFAEEIFISIKNPKGENYCAIIQGMVKYYQIDRATQLFEEAKQKNLRLNADTYNAMIEAGNLLKENFDMRWAYIIQMLNEMNTNKIKPNLGTLNAVLYCLNSMGNRFPKESALKILSEFKQLGIQPSLASWNFVLQIFCKEKGPTSTILIDILNEIENKNHEIRDIRDVNFFLTSMSICRYHLNDFGVAKRVNALLHYGNNYDLIGDSFRESVYYRHYFINAVNSLPIQEFMDIVYSELVPHIYTPEMGVIEEILKQIDATAAVEFIPKLWSDMVTFDCIKRDTLVTLIVDIMVHNEPKNDAVLQDRFANIANNIYEKIMNQDEKRFNGITITGELLGNILLLFVRNKSMEKAWEIFVALDKNHQKILGVPKFEALSALIDASIEIKSPTKALSVIEYGIDAGYEDLDSLARKLQEKLTLDETHYEKLSKMLGHHVIVTKQ